ncbi:EamA-like transporter family protein [Corynebacterium ciconiae DSM 44920]|uniref:EamA family transporter RarD n=1 Tax=Corynebacterium ciconiae TaxID=227319 RepID=UPI000361DB8F|nr:EamA family transporter RarD [Corynebacterium ciconiae]WKD60804.1 EamA-like transporter family protein [Corynebacterium ciconiae DSM 44920]
MVYGVLAYLLWGLFPAYFPLLEPASPFEILAHRIVWTAVVMGIVIIITGAWKELWRAGSHTWLIVAAAAVVIAINWLVYVIAVTTDHVAEAALGYFINPLVAVVLGLVFLGERLRPLQKVSVITASIAVTLLLVFSSTPPLIGLTLAFSFAVYGLLKKRVPLSAHASLAAETIVLLPFAAAFLIWLEASGRGTFFDHGFGHMGLLASAGAVTALPLLLFGMAAQRIPLATVGMLQYMTPTIQMLWALFVTHEHLDQVRWIGFIIIWVSVAIFIVDIGAQRVQYRSRSRRARRG